MAKTKAQLTTENNANFPNNNSQFITPEKLRGFNQDMIDSLVDEITYTADSASFDSRINNVTVDTGSLLVTASFNDGTRNMTFTKGDSSIFDVSIPVGTPVLPSGLVSGSSQIILQSTTGNLSGSRIDGLIPSASYAITASFALNAGGSGDTGSLLVTASNDFSQITFTKGNASTFELDVTPRRVVETVKNKNGFMPKGTPVYVSGSTGNELHVYQADAGDPTRVPATFILDQNLNTNESGLGILSGFINGVDTSLFAEGANIYLAVGGGYTDVQPTGSAFIQKLGNVVKSDLNGSGVISGAGRVNALPNIAQNKVWVGDSNGVPQEISKNNLGLALTGSNNTFTGTQTFNDIVVNGTGSFAYIQSVTGSAKIIGDAFIILNNDLPAERYAGIVVQDSGSGSPLTTASLEFDGQTNDWFYEYSDDGGVTTDHGVVLFGPEYATKGSPTYPSSNVIQKGTGGHHLTGSNISDDGTKVSINSNTQVTGSLLVSSSAAQLVKFDVADGFGTGFKIDNGTNEFYTYLDQWSNVRKSDSEGIIISQTYGLDMFNGTFTKDIGFALNMNVAAGTGTNKSGIWGVGPGGYYDFISFEDATNWTDGRVQVHRALQVDGKLHANDGIVSSGSLDISGSILLNGSVRANVTNLAISSQTASIDFNEGTMFQLTLVSGSTTHLDATNINQGQTLNLLVIQPDTGTGSLDFAPKFLQPTGSEYTPTPSSFAQDVLTLVTFVNTSQVFVANVKEFV